MARETIVDTDDQAYGFFVQESLELLQLLETGLLTLSQDHDTQKIHGLMRAAHSIKGGAACIGLVAIQTIAHDLENGIRALYKEDVAFDLQLEDILLKAFDCLRSPINDQIQNGVYDAESALERAQPIFRELEAKLGHGLEEAAEFPEVNMDGDITEFIFAEEVPQALARLDNFLKKPPAKQVDTELKSQIEVLATLGEMLGLKGFAAIAQTAMEAIDVHPDQCLEIGKLAIADFRMGQAAVIGGDRTVGGGPSPALSAFLAPSADAAPVVAQPEPEPEPEQEQELNDVLSLDELAALQELTIEDDAAPDTSLTADDWAAGLIIEDDEEIVPAPVVTKPVVPTPVVSTPVVAKAETVGNGKVTPKPPAVEVKPLEVKPIAAKAAEPKPPEVAPEKISMAAPVSETASPMLDASNMSIRLEMSRLNQINNLVGELVTQDNSFLLRNQQNQAAIESLKRWYNRFNKLTTQFQQYSKELVVKNPQARSQLAQFVVFASTMAEEMAQLAETIEDASLIKQQDQQLSKQRQQTLKQLEHNLLEARMLPIGDLLNRFPRTVRDLSVTNNKPVKLNLEGNNTMVDRAVLSKLYDPLVHLVRNAFDHGIDSAEERQARGKDAEGTITIKAYNRGNSTYVEVKDDGQGIDATKIRDKAIQTKLLTPEEAANMTESQLYELIFVPGFSTAAKVSHISGRGVGLDAVRLQIRALKGNITLTSERGKGTTFTLRLPWSMTITKLLVFRCQDSFFAIPVNSLAAIAAAGPSDLIKDKDKPVYLWQNRKVPLVQELLYNYNYPSSLITSRQQMLGNWQSSAAWNNAGQQMILVLSQGLDFVGIKTDQILLEQDLVIKPFGTSLNPPAYLSGCTVLGDGRLIPVLDGSSLIERALKKTMRSPTIDPTLLQGQPKLVLPTVLVIDDSLTTRQTLSKTLQKGGYRVIQAQDGVDGLNQLEQHPEVEGIICDVEMPQMNGFEFLGRCRKKHPIDELPVLMLTSRSSKRYRQLAKQLGSNGYLTKPYLDQELIETLQQAIEESKPKSKVTV